MSPDDEHRPAHLTVRERWQKQSFRGGVIGVAMVIIIILAIAFLTPWLLSLGH